MYSIVDHVSNGSVKTFSIPFPYLAEEDIKVYVNNILQSSAVYTFPTSSTITLDSQPANGLVVRIQRVTRRDSLLIDFQNAALLTEKDLDTNAQQLFYLMQECIDNNDAQLAQDVLSQCTAIQNTVEGLKTAADVDAALAHDYAEKAEDSQVETGTYSAHHWANKAQAYAAQANGMPAGSIIAYGGASVPNGWLECDGSAVSRSTYSALFTAIGTTWGIGNGSTTFNLPDLRDKVPMGASGTKALGSSGGAASVTLTTPNLPAHNHTVTIDTSSTHTHDIDAVKLNSTNNGFLAGGAETGVPKTVVGQTPVNGDVTSAAGGAHTHTNSVSNTGTGTSFSILPPYGAVKMLIKT